MSPLPAIGVAHTSYRETETTPVQANANPAESGTIELFPDYVAGLAGLEGFDYAWLLSWLHEPSGPAPLTQVPFLLRPQGRATGMFATRTPRRVNPIGLSLVRLLGVAGATVSFAGVDLLDGTPILDLKPYVTRFDLPAPLGGGPAAGPAAGAVRCGWFDEIPVPDGITPADLGPQPPHAG